MLDADQRLGRTVKARHNGAMMLEHNHSHDAFIGAAEARLRQKGHRLTEQRKAVLEALLAAHKPSGAYDIIERLAIGGAKKLAPVAIYRALEFLKQNGLAHRIESLNAFIACPHGHSDDHDHQGASLVFMLCTACGHAEEVEAPSLKENLQQLAAQYGFQTHGQMIEMAGMCRECAAQRPVAQGIEAQQYGAV